MAVESGRASEAARVGEPLRRIREEVGRVVVGQRELVDGLLVGLLADGHVLLEGVPGIAKSLTVATLARALDGVWHRIQFTPDLLPSDLVGTQVLDQASGTWTRREGPLFANIVLADEINRAPAKVQAALLEAMQERTVSLAGETRALPQPFLVLATQNPLDQEGTYPLPEAQTDRFMLKLLVDLPGRDDEREILARMTRTSGHPQAQAVATLEEILAARAILDELHCDESITESILDLVFATRDPAAAGLPELAGRIVGGASPRASIALARASRAHALLEGRDHVEGSDVRAMAPAVLRHRIVTSFEAEAAGEGSEWTVARILDALPLR